MRIITFCLLLTIIGCGKDGSSTAVANPDTQPDTDTPSSYTGSVFSGWRQESLGQASISLLGMSFGVPALTTVTYRTPSTGAPCACDVTVTGTETSGTIKLQNCVSMDATYGDPAECTAMEGGGATYTYTRSAATLRVCRSGCIFYQSY